MARPIGGADKAKAVALRHVGIERRVCEISTQVKLQWPGYANGKDAGFGQFLIFDRCHVTRGKNPIMFYCLKRGRYSNEAFVRCVQSAFSHPCGRLGLCDPKDKVRSKPFSIINGARCPA